MEQNILVKTTRGGVFIMMGAAIFSTSSASRVPFAYEHGLSTFFGYLCIFLYILCDAFTVQWQEKLYQTYGRRNVDPVQMMLGTSIFGIMITSSSLVLSNDFGIVFEFLRHNHWQSSTLVWRQWCRPWVNSSYFFLFGNLDLLFSLLPWLSDNFFPLSFRRLNLAIRSYPDGRSSEGSWSLGPWPTKPAEITFWHDNQRLLFLEAEAQVGVHSYGWETLSAAYCFFLCWTRLWFYRFHMYYCNDQIG